MALFQELSTLLDERPVWISVAKSPEGLLTVNIMPKLLKDEKAEDPVVKGRLQECTITGTIEQVDARMIEEVKAWLNDRTQFLSNVKTVRKEFEEQLKAYKEKLGEQLTSDKKQLDQKQKTAAAKPAPKAGKPEPAQVDLVESAPVAEGTDAAPATAAPQESQTIPETAEQAPADSRVSHDTAPANGSGAPAAGTSTHTTIPVTPAVSDLLTKVAKPEHKPVRALKGKTGKPGPVAVPPAEEPGDGDLSILPVPPKLSGAATVVIAEEIPDGTVVVEDDDSLDDSPF